MKVIMSYLSFANRFSGLFVALIVSAAWVDYCKAHEVSNLILIFGMQFIAMFFISNLMKVEH